VPRNGPNEPEPRPLLELVASQENLFKRNNSQVTALS
jgi:hypothetical protein